MPSADRDEDANGNAIWAIRNTTRVNHSFTVLKGSQDLYTVHGHCAYVAVGRDVIELILNAEPPYFNRIKIGHRPTGIEVHSYGRRIALRVFYEAKEGGFVAIYRKDKNRNWWLNTVAEVEGHQDVHDVTSRSEIVNGEFVTVSPDLHYFCYIEAVLPGISCVNVEHAITEQTTQNYTGTGIVVLPNTNSVMCSSYANCPAMESLNEFLGVMTQTCELYCENVTMIFNMSTLQNTANITRVCNNMHDCEL